MDSTNVNWVELADKALTMGQSAVSELITLVKTATPEVWEMALRQVYADALGGLVLPLTLLIVMPFISKQCWIRCSETTSEGMGFFYGGMGVVSVVGTVVGLVCSAVSLELCIKSLINPNYYALLKIAKIAGLGQ